MAEPEEPQTTEAAPRYTRWCQPYEAALARGHDNGSAAYIADQWEAKHMDQTHGTGIIQDAPRTASDKRDFKK